MRKVYFLLVVLTVLMVLSFGCATPKTAVITEPSKPGIVADAPPPENAFYFYTESQLSRKKGDIDTAIDYLKRASKLDPDSVFLKKELVQLYWQNKDDQAANSLVDELISAYPDDLEILILFARIKHSLKYFDEAKIAYEKVISKDPKQKNIYMLLGDIYTEEGNLAFALQVYKNLVKEFPDFFAGYYLMAQLNAQMGNTSEAEKNYLHALQIEPTLEEARFELVDLYKKMRRKGYQKDVIQLYREILADNPGDIRAAILLGYFYHEMGKAAESEKIFKILGQKSKSDKQVLQYVIQLYIEQQQFDAALTILKQMLTGAPESSEIYYIMGVAYDGKKDVDRAIKQLKKVRPASDFFHYAAVHISYLYQEQGKIEEAIAYLKSVIQIEPENPEFMLYLGGLYEESGAFQDAETVLKKGIEIDPENTKLYFRLGIIYDRWGKKENSIDMMRMVIRIDPEDANALNYLGYTYADLGENLDEAEMLIKEALKYRPEDGYITDSLGWVYYKKGRYENALEILKKATDLVPDDPTILEHLGDVYIKTNENKKALEIYRKSLMNAKNGAENLRKKIQELIDQGY